MSELLLFVQTALMAWLAYWSYRKVTYHMSFVATQDRAATAIPDALAVCAIGGGALEHALYNFASVFAPTVIRDFFGPMDLFFMTLLYLGAAWWITAPMIRKAIEERRYGRPT